MQKVYYLDQTVFWNIYMAILIFFYIVQIPFQLAYRDEVISLTQFHPIYATFQIIAIISLIIEIYVRMNTGYLENGVFIQDLDLIRDKYMTLAFYIDILGLVSVVISFIQMYTLHYFTLIFYLKIYSLAYYDSCLEWVWASDKKKSALYKILKGCFYLFIFSHWAAIIIFAMDYSQYLQQGFNFQNQLLWLIYQQCLSQLITFPINIQYQYSLYWAIMTATGVAYGDFFPKNFSEAMFTTVMLLPIFVLMGYLLNVSFQTFIINDENRDQQYEKLKCIGKRNQKKQIQGRLSHIICSYTKYQINSVIENKYEQQSEIILNSLSKELKYELYSQIYNTFFQELFFQNNPIKYIVELIQQEIYFPYQTFYCQDNYIVLKDGCIFKGICGLDVAEFENRSIILDKIKDFGKLNNFNFIAGIINPFNFCNTTTMTHIMLIKHKQFIQNENYEFYQKNLRFLRDEFLIRKNYTKYNLTCEFCQSSQHIILECPQLILIMNKNIIKKAIKIEKIQQNLRVKQIRMQLRQMKKAKNFFGIKCIKFQEEIIL